MITQYGYYGWEVVDDRAGCDICGYLEEVCECCEECRTEIDYCECSD